LGLELELNSDSLENDSKVGVKVKGEARPKADAVSEPMPKSKHKMSPDWD